MHSKTTLKHWYSANNRSINKHFLLNKLVNVEQTLCHIMKTCYTHRENKGADQLHIHGENSFSNVPVIRFDHLATEERADCFIFVVF